MGAEMVVIVSDTHVGSTRAVCNPDFEGEDGKGPPRTNNQKFLWNHWQSCEKWAKSITGKAGFDMVLNGDLVEGVHHRTTQIWSNEPGDHVAAAAQLIGPLAEHARDMYVVTGTEAHVGNSEHGLAEHFGAVRPKGQKGAFDRLDLRVNGKITRFVHHMGTSARLGLYGTGLSVALAEHQVQASRAGQPVPDVVVAGHRHTFGVYEDGRAMMVSCPAWQLLTRFGYKVAWAAVPVVGMVVLDFRGVGVRGKEGRALPVVHRRLATYEGEVIG